MATCPKCNEEYEGTESSCPHCVAGQAEKKQFVKLKKNYSEDDAIGFRFSLKFVLLLVVGIFFVIFVAGIIAGIMSGDEEIVSEAKAPKETAAKAEAEFSFDDPDVERIVLPERKRTDEDDIYDIFDKVVEANLAEDMSLFQEAYSENFPDWAERKRKTLELWRTYDFLTLDYFVGDIQVAGDKSEVSIGWRMALLEPGTDKPLMVRTTNDVIVVKEPTGWKIIKVD